MLASPSYRSTLTCEVSQACERERHEHANEPRVEDNVRSLAYIKAMA